MDEVRILVIDNDRAHLEKLESYPKESHFTLVVADTLDGGLRELRRSFFDIVLAELRLRALPGLDLVDQIRSAHPGTGVMLMSAEVHVDLVIEALRRRAIDFIIKPVAPEVLIQRVEAAVLVRSNGVDIFLHYCLQTMRHLFSERGITPRERQVIMLLLKGLRYQEVAARLFYILSNRQNACQSYLPQARDHQPQPDHGVHLQAHEQLILRAWCLLHRRQGGRLLEKDGAPPVIRTAAAILLSKDRIS